MKLAFCAVLLAVGCHKGNKATESSGSAGSAGSATTGSATAGNGSAGSAAGDSPTAGSATAGSAGSAQAVAALDELDRWLAPLAKLDIHPRYVAMCADAQTLAAKAGALKPLGEGQAWSDAVDKLSGDIDGFSLCCQDLADYDKLPPEGKTATDHTDRDCMKPVAASFAAVVALVPGAKPPGTHAGDPPITSPAK